jgi:hypothetical protein
MYMKINLDKLNITCNKMRGEKDNSGPMIC